MKLPKSLKAWQTKEFDDVLLTELEDAAFPLELTNQDTFSFADLDSMEISVQETDHDDDSIIVTMVVGYDERTGSGGCGGEINKSAKNCDVTITICKETGEVEYEIGEPEVCWFSGKWTLTG